MRRFVIAGASRGLGAEVARHYTGAGAEVLSLSRSPSAHGDWRGCDLADPGQIAAVAAGIKGAIDALIYVAGIWEERAFAADYSFEGSSPQEIGRILMVNLQAPILLARALAPQLRDGRIVLIGSTSGLDNIGTPEVAYNASKAGLRGAAQALAQALKGQGTSVSILNPGDFATPQVLAAKQAGAMRAEGSLPVADLLAGIDFLLNLTPGAGIFEVNLLPLAP